MDFPTTIATPPPHQTTSLNPDANVDADIDVDTDYGSDFSDFSPSEAEIITRLVAQSPTTPPPDIEDNPITGASILAFDSHDPQPTLRIPRVLVGQRQRGVFGEAARGAKKGAERIASADSSRTGYPDLSRQLKDVQDSTEAEEAKMRRRAQEGTQIANDNGIEEKPLAAAKAPDTRSPLERFRTKPKKALSVTDLVSPAWCELQYWFTLTRHGKKVRTPAMKRGSAMHQELEEEVHTRVKIDVETKEDAWGVRIWNVIQGLRTLRTTGLTRELEVWGTLDGLVVIGVIDELSYICPDTALEAASTKPTPQDEPPPNQRTLSEFFQATDAAPLPDAMRTQQTKTNPSPKIYLCDVKTRSGTSLPSAPAFRPTKMQLMLYHRLLSALATNTIDFTALTTRYNLDASRVFSDALIAQVGSLNEEIFYDAETSHASGLELDAESEPTWSQDSLATLLAHNTLEALWGLMLDEFRRTLPHGADSLGRVLKAEYRSRDSGDVVGRKTFAMDGAELQAYVKREMQWWRGEREPQGVVLEEAFKCRTCEFADACEWRLKKVEEATEKVRMRRKRTSEV